jgi:hypothetical protein
LTEWIIFDIYRITFFDIGCAVQILERFVRRRLAEFAIPALREAKSLLQFDPGGRDFRFSPTSSREFNFKP